MENKTTKTKKNTCSLCDARYHCFSCPKEIKLLTKKEIKSFDLLNLYYVPLHDLKEKRF